MSLIVRKIELSKWKQRNITGGEPPSADAITNCMRTSKNTLSVWGIESSTDLEEAVLAIASQFDHLDTADFLIIETELLDSKGLSLENTPGFTPYKEFVNQHRDVIDLDYHKLGDMADVIVESIKRAYNQRFTKAMLKKILVEGIQQGKIDPEELKESVRSKLD